MRSLISILLAIIGLNTAYAEVAKSSAEGFIIEQSVDVTTEPAAVFAVMTGKVGEWWNPEHTYSGVGANLQIDKRCYCERWDGNLVHHLNTAIWVENSKVVFEGGLGPLKDFGLDGTMIWSLLPNDSDGTTISWKYYVNGFTDTDLTALAPVVDSVLAEQLRRLQEHLNNK